MQPSRYTDEDFSQNWSTYVSDFFYKWERGRDMDDEDFLFKFPKGPLLQRVADDFAFNHHQLIIE